MALNAVHSCDGSGRRKRSLSRFHQGQKVFTHSNLKNWVNFIIHVCQGLVDDHVINFTKSLAENGRLAVIRDLFNLFSDPKDEHERVILSLSPVQNCLHKIKLHHSPLHLRRIRASGWNGTGYWWLAGWRDRNQGGWNRHRWFFEHLHINQPISSSTSPGIGNNYAIKFKWESATWLRSHLEIY